LTRGPARRVRTRRAADRSGARALAGGAGPPGLVAGDEAVDEVRTGEVLVIGAGVAGLAAALGCAPRRVTLLTKAPLGAGGSTAWAQGGIAAALAADDAPALHAADTRAAAAGLAVDAAVERLTEEGPRRIAALLALGARFDRDPVTGGLALGREAAHGRRRILHAGGDATGAELSRALAAAVRRAGNVRVEEGSFALDLAVDPRGGRRRVVGAFALDPDGRRVLHLAGAVVLATGGAGRLYPHTTNPPEVTADGLAMAARAGARLADLELVQFHPTALAAPVATGGSDVIPSRCSPASGGEESPRSARGDRPAAAPPLPLLTEALRGEGAVLVDERGRRFMPDEHPAGELAPRDVVARAIHRRLAAGGRVYLDARAALGDRFPERFPTAFRAARAAGLDPRSEPLPVVPAAHYHMGGVATDLAGRTSLPGLWACGEAASNGVHGANRLASNSLLEGLVFGAAVADELRAAPVPLPSADPATLGRLEIGRRGGSGNDDAPGSRREVVDSVRGNDAVREKDAGPAERRVSVGGGGVDVPLAEVRRRLHAVMEERVGLVRSGEGLQIAARELEALERRLGATAGAAPGGDRAPDVSAETREQAESANLVLAARLVAASALARTESRGAHFREDCPGEDPGQRHRLFTRLLTDGSIEVVPARRLGSGAAAAGAVGRPS